ncbi:hypothetical protein JB92DRAFT_3128953 [Gautieria morchelliformis]|nr:hypothetical protein JB92DRAFT_3128953 [Gautieria morchelliformis]
MTKTRPSRKGKDKPAAKEAAGKSGKRKAVGSPEPMEPERRESTRPKKTVRLDEALNTIRQISSDVEYSTEEDSDFIPHETVEAVSDTESIADVSIQSTDELEPPAKVLRGKGRPKGSSVKKVLTICTLAVIVPDGRSNSGGSQRLTMKSSTPFAVAISMIHEAMGCTGVKVKPEGKYLAYSVKGLGGKGISLKMMGSADWIAMQEHIKTLIKRRDSHPKYSTWKYFERNSHLYLVANEEK